MTAQVLEIEGRARVNDVAFVQPGDFVVRRGAIVDAGVILDRPNLSLYCLDPERGEALFVETPAGLDLTAAPFLYQAQYQHALRLYAVPYDALHRIARDAKVDMRGLILVFSTGRCGSTLVSRALRQAPGVASFSEPDVYSQILMLREPDGRNDAQVSALLRSCTVVSCAAAARHGSYSRWALKFRSFGAGLADLFQANFPQAKLIFLYRGARPWALSVGRAFGFFDPAVLEWMGEFQKTFARLVPQVAAFSATQERTISPQELLACMWVSVMEQGLALRQRGGDLLAARYEDVQRAPQEWIAAILEHCGLSADRVDLQRVLGADAQAGTSVAKDAVAGNAVASEKEQVDEVCRLVPRFGPGLTEAFRIPGSLVPAVTEQA